MSRASDALHLLLAHDENEYRAEPIAGPGLPAKALRNPPRPAEAAKTTHMASRSGDPDDLPAQRWGVVAPAGELGDRLLAVIRPLIEARQTQQGAPATILRTPNAAALSMADAQCWRDEVYLQLGKPASARQREAGRPRYLLILGDLHQVPETIHQIQGIDSFVGRLAFTRESGEPDESRYAAYVDKLLRWERTAAAVTAPPRFFVVQDGTPATATGMAGLVEPTLGLLAKERQLGVLSTPALQSPTDAFLTEPSALLAAANTPDPTVLFTVSHGTGTPRSGWSSSARQRLIQGSMHFGPEGKLTASDLGEQPFLPGGMWFMFACYAAGTPSASLFRPWLERLRSVGQFGSDVDSALAGLPKAGERPFIAALPQALLASPSGPLAFMGHLDLSWSYAFQDLGDDGPVGQPGRFAHLVKALLQRKRVGNAMHEVLHFINAANSQLGIYYNQKESTRSEQDSDSLGHYWMIRQELMGYVLLGDPAARLATTSPGLAPPIGVLNAPPAPAPPDVAAAARLSSLMGFSVAPPPEVGGLPIPLVMLEKAICKYQAAELYDKSLTAESIAKEYGLSALDLKRYAALYRDAGRSALLGRR